MFFLLYVDDEPGLLEIGQLFLEGTGDFSVTTALSGRAGLEKLAQHTFDAIIADYQMPEMDGIEFLKTVRQSFGNIPFILFTGRGREQVVIEAINQGVDFYLQKGGDPKVQFVELAHKVRQAVSRRQAETALSDSEKRLADIINFLPDATFAIDTRGVVIAWNRAMEMMTGVSSKEILGKGNFEYALPFYRERRPLLINIVLDDDPAIAAKYPFIKKEGQTLFSEIAVPHFHEGRGAELWFTASPLYNRKGDVVGAIESIREITDRKRAEENLVSANREYTNLLDQIQDVYYRSDIGGRLVRASRSWATLFGYDDVSECIGRSIADDFYVNPSDRKQLLEEIYRNGKVTGYEVLLKKKDGTQVLIEASSHLYFDPAGKIIGIEGTFRDITDRKKREEELQLVKISVDQSADEVFWLDFEGNILHVNDAACRITGYSRDEFLKMKIYDLDPDFLPEVWGASVADLRERKNQHFITRHRRKDGVILDVEIVAVYVNQDGKEYSFAFVRDITERKRAEEALKTRSEEYQDILRTAMDGFCIIGMDGSFIDVNDAFCILHGYTREEMLALSLPDIEVRENPEEASRRTKEIMKKGWDRFETKFRQKDGSINDVEVSVVYSEAYGGCFIAFSRDITERKKVETELQAAYAQVTLNEEELRERYEELFEAQAELYTHRQQLEEIASTVPGVVFQFYARPDGSRGMYYVSSRDIEIFGLRSSLEEFVPAFTSCVHPDDRARFLSSIDDVVKRSADWKFEGRFIKPIGETIWFEGISSPVVHGNELVFTGVMLDITDRKLMEAEIHAQQQQLNNILQNLPVGIFRSTPGPLGKSIISNPVLAHMHGFEDIDEFMDSPIANLYADPAVRNTISDLLMQKGALSNLEIHLKKKNGELFWAVMSAVVVRGPDGTVEYFDGILEDITDRKEAEEALQQIERWWQQWLEESPVPMALYRLDGTVLFSNKQYIKTLGWTMEDIPTLDTWFITVHPNNPGYQKEMKEAWGQRVRAAIAKGEFIEPLEARVYCKDGSTRILEFTGLVIGDTVLTTFYDLTTRKQTEEALSESEKKYRMLVEHTRDGVYIVQDDRLVFYNQAFSEFTGYSPEEMIGHPISTLIAPEFRELVVSRARDRAAGKPLPESYEFALLHKDGVRKIWVRIDADVGYFRGRPASIGVLHNITEDRAREEALRESEEKYRTLVETTSDFIWEVDAGGTYTYVSPQVRQILGYEPEEMIGRTPFDFMPPDDVERVAAEFNRCVTSRLPVVALENKAIRKDGSVIILETSGVVRTSNDGSYWGYRGIDRDITTRKQTAEWTARLSALKQDLLRTAPVEEKLKRITDAIVNIFGADFARIWMSGPGDLCDHGCIHAGVTEGPHVCRNRTSCLHLIVSSGRYTHTDGGHRRVPFGAYKIGRLATGEEAQFITNDVTHDPRVHDHTWAESLGLVSFSGFRLLSPEGKPIGVLAFFSRQKVTPEMMEYLDDLANTASQVIQTSMAEEAQRERETWARTILDTAQAGIVLIDAETHRILDANPNALELIDLPRDSVIGAVCHRYICPAEEGNCPVTDGGQNVDTSDRILLTGSGKIIPVLKTVVPVFLGGKKILVESFVDISELKRAEAAIQEANRKLNLLNSITRHDIRNQLMVVQGFTRLAALRKPDATVMDFLAKITTTIETIQRQIEFTKTYQELGVHAPAWFRVDEVVSSVRPEKIALRTICGAVEIFADPMIDKVFFNLFDNAVMYGERATTVTVGCEKQKNGLVITFADNGIGIPPGEKLKIFEKGYGKSTGLGLFLAREILAITGITIHETGTYEEGAVFEITVPEEAYRKAD